MDGEVCVLHYGLIAESQKIGYLAADGEDGAGADQDPAAQALQETVDILLDAILYDLEVLEKVGLFMAVLYQNRASDGMGIGLI